MIIVVGLKLCKIIKDEQKICVLILDGIVVCAFWTEKMCANFGWNRGVRISDGKVAC